MFDRTYITREETRCISKNINIHEYRASTDESIKLLNEFQEKALDNIICKIKSNVYNDLKFECYFTSVIKYDTFVPDGVLILVTNINGKEYKKKVRVSGNMNTLFRSMKGEYDYLDIDSKLQTFIYLQICLIVADILCGNNELEKIIREMTTRGISDFDFKTLENL